jgi:ATP-binding cassette subfamily B protein
VKYLPRVFRYLKPHWTLGLISIVLLVLTVLAGLLTPWPMKILVDSVLRNPPVPFTGVLSRTLNPIARQPFALLLFAVMSGLLLAIVQNGFLVLNNYVNTRLDQNIVLDFRTELFEHAERLSMSYHDRRRASRIDDLRDQLPG